jgi:hypothetical protein
MNAATGIKRPVRLSLCWVPKPEAPNRCCTIKDPNHEGDHHHEYTGASWPRKAGEKSAR